MSLASVASRQWEALQAQCPDQPKFLQASQEILHSLSPVLEEDPRYERWLSLLMTPERILQFRVVWYDDRHRLQINRGFRVQFSSLLGPYKGGLRFHPTVGLDTVKFLALEQTFKNALTQLMLGSGKGGSDFDPKGKSDNEIRRFCEAFMLELHRFIGPGTDVPAGDIGVGGREIGHLYHMYRKLRNEHDCVLTGKAFAQGGSHLRPEATGYGLVYLVEEWLSDHKEALQGKRVVVSGSGNVARHAAEKLLELGAKVLTLSDSQGLLHFPYGAHKEDLVKVAQLKEERVQLKAFPLTEGVFYYPHPRQVWAVASDVDIALPCATENELGATEAASLVARGCRVVGEGANMPCTPEAVAYLHKSGVAYLCGKAANAGGVAVSGLEMVQGASRHQWTREEVDFKLRAIMKSIYRTATQVADQYGVPFCDGANIAAFRRLAAALEAEGY